MPKSVDINLKTFYTNIIKKNPLYLPHQFIVTFEGADLPAEFASDPTNHNSLTYYVKSSSVPEVTIAEQTVNFLGQDFVVPKGVTYGGTWQVTCYAMASMYHYNALRAWCEQFADLKNNGGGKKTIPNVKATVHLIDSTMTQDLHDFVLEGVFPSKVPDLSMKYENAANIPDLQLEFTYQYMYRLDEEDPLAAS